MIDKFVKSICGFFYFQFPKSLYKRFVLIIVLPVFLIQVGSFSFFINRNWIKNSNKYIENVVQQILFVKKIYEEGTDLKQFNALNNKFLKLQFREIVTYENILHKSKMNPINLHIIKQVLKQHFPNSFSVVKTDKKIFITLNTSKKFLEFQVEIGDILFASNHVFLLFNILLTLIFLAIAWLFMKNQVAPIIALSKSINDFRQKRKSIILKPRGALEIKNVIDSFNTMSQEIVYYISEQNIALAGISHDIKTYLTRMQLQIALYDDQSIAKDLHDDITAMDNIICGFLQYSRSDIYIMNQMQKLDLSNLINDILKKLKINYDFQPIENFFILGDDNGLRRCFLNIISNSEKFANFLKIAIFKDEEFAYVTFDDNGPGVSENDLPFLLKPFYKSDKSRNMNQGGVGLGLAIADNIISKHEGELIVSNSKILSGFHVTVKLKKI